MIPPTRVPCYSGIASYERRTRYRQGARFSLQRRLHRPRRLRLRLADAWGEMGAAWGVAPAIARVHAYLMARQVPLTEREVREALGLSHRAASLALAEAEAWGIVERVAGAAPRRPARARRHGLSCGRRPLAVVQAGHCRAKDPRRRPDRRRPRADRPPRRPRRPRRPDDEDLAALRDWLTTFLVFVRLFDRAVGLSRSWTARAGAWPAAPRRGARRHDPAPRPPARRARRRRRP